MCYDMLERFVGVFFFVLAEGTFCFTSFALLVFKAYCLYYGFFPSRSEMKRIGDTHARIL